MLTFWGLKTCDTCKKAREWLTRKNIPFEQRDVRADGVTAELLAGWAAAVGWETLLNKSSTTWRGLSDDVKTAVDEAKAIDLMAERPTLIKRPVFQAGGQVIVGFRAAQREALEKNHTLEN